MITVTDFKNADYLKKPRRIRRYVLLWCKQGEVKMQVDENEFLLTQNSVITITSGQVHYIIESRKAEGFVMEFTYDFFCKDDNDIELIFHNSLFCHFAMNEVIQLNKSKVVEEELNQIACELATTPYQHFITIHNRISLILVEINRQKILSGAEIWKPDALFLKFLEAIMNNFKENPKTETIANMLGVTVATLNKHSKLHTGRTAQSVISGLVTSEAKRLFRYEKLSVKETAYALGFNDPFYFSNFFKKQTGISPKEYQEELSS